MRTASIILGIALVAGCSDASDQNQHAQYQDPLNSPEPRESSASARAETTENLTVAPAAARTPQPSQSPQTPQPLPPPSPADKPDRARDPLVNSSDALLPDFVRLPDELLSAIQVRRMYANAIEVDPAFGSSVTADQIRTKLSDSRNMIERAVSSAKWLQGTLPTEPTLSEAELNSNVYLDLVQSRLQVNGRELLLTDAIRCWEKGDANGCAERLGASLRIAHFLLAQSDQRTRLRGQQVLIPAIFELAGRIRNGMLERSGGTIRSELARQVNKVDVPRLPQLINDDSRFANAIKQCKTALGSGD